MSIRSRNHEPRHGFTLLEIMLAVVIAGVVAALGISHLRRPGIDAHQRSCNANRELLQGFAQQFADERGSLPSTNLSELTAVNYFDATLPKCPSTRQPYELRGGVVSCPVHEMTR